MTRRSLHLVLLGSLVVATALGCGNEPLPASSGGSQPPAGGAAPGAPNGDTPVSGGSGAGTAPGSGGTASGSGAGASGDPGMSTGTSGTTTPAPGTGATACGAGRPPCPSGTFCESPAGTCGKGDQAGVCRARAQACREIYQPVCGCDGKTYGNDCERQVAGVSKLNDGACAPSGSTGKVCGGIAAIKCGDREYCEYATGICGKGDQTGVCRARPDACTLQYAPVCGCDGKTYGNDCARASAGVSKLSEGACGMSTPAPRLLPAGAWGGEHIALYVKDATLGASLEFDCATGTIMGPLELQPDGTFKWRGTYTPGTGGPVQPGVVPPSVPTTYAGRVSGETMTLEVYPDGRPATKYTLTLGKMPLLFRCQ